MKVMLEVTYCGKFNGLAEHLYVGIVACSVIINSCLLEVGRYRFNICADCVWENFEIFTPIYTYGRDEWNKTFFSKNVTHD